MMSDFHKQQDSVDFGTEKSEKNDNEVELLSCIELCLKPGKDKLDLCDKELKYIPCGVLNLSHLQYLYLEDNLINEIPTEFCENLKLLTWFDIRRNNLIHLPDNINQLINLKHLLLEGNRIEELPVQLGHLVGLKAINLRFNPLTFPPEDIIAKGTQEILKFLRKYESRPEEVQNHFVPELTEKLRLLSIINDDYDDASSKKRGSLSHRCPMVSYYSRQPSLEDNMLNLLRHSVSSLELKNREESFQRYSLPLIKKNSPRLDSMKKLRKSMFEESERKFSTKRETRTLDRKSKRKLNEKTDKNIQALKDKKSLDDWRKAKKATKNKEKDSKFEQKHEIIIPYGHDDLAIATAKKNNVPVVEKKTVPEQRLADINRLSLNEQLENRIKEHVQNIKNWRRNRGDDLMSLEKELSETTENLEKAEQLRKQLQAKNSKEYRFRAFTGGDYSYVPTSYY